MLKSEHYERVEKFMVGCEQVDNSTRVPYIPDERTRALRARLILEECLETVNALGFNVEVERLPSAANTTPVEMKFIHLHPNSGPDLVEIVDGCCDIMVVTTGTLIASGVTDVEPLKVVDENNLLKLKNGTFDAHGKLIKPLNHPDVKPELAQLLAAQAD